VSNRYLIEEPPILVMPTLAKVIGLSESIVLQQLHYWLQRSNNVRDGRTWVYNSIKDWEVQFPFWSGDTIKRNMRNLRDMEVIITANYNTMPMDRTLWYSIDYEKLNALMQNPPTISAKPTNGKGQVAPSNNQRLPENTTENTTPVVVVEEHAAIAEIYTMWSDQTKGTLTSISADILGGMIDSYGAEAVKHAIIDAEKQGKRSLSYIEGILRNRLAGTEPQQKQQPAQRTPQYGKQSKVDGSMAAVENVFAKMREQGITWTE
jgi:DnaD/phage-associated family protein